MPELATRPPTRAAVAATPSQAPTVTGGADSLTLGGAGNAAAQEMVGGPIGRVFNRILGADEERADTSTQGFSRDQLRQYVDVQLQMAEGEWFRDTKLDGVSDALITQLDKDGDGMVGWGEFGVFRDQVLAQIAPGTRAGATPDQVAAAAGTRFGQLDKGKGSGGKLTMGGAETGTLASLPEGTDNADLIAQLGARIALDAVDTDQRKAPVKDRTLSREEWSAAARGIASGR